MSHLLDTGLAIAAIGLLAAAGVGVVRSGLLVEPVDMQAVGPCGLRCTQVRCVMENQGPIRAVGAVVIDVWSDGGYQDGTLRHEVGYDLGPGERVEVRYDFDGAPYVAGRTIARCMPRYAAGPHRPAAIEPPDRP